MCAAYYLPAKVYTAAMTTGAMTATLPVTMTHERAKAGLSPAEYELWAQWSAICNQRLETARWNYAAAEAFVNKNVYQIHVYNARLAELDRALASSVAHFAGLCRERSPTSAWVRQLLDHARAYGVVGAETPQAPGRG